MASDSPQDQSHHQLLARFESVIQNKSSHLFQLEEYITIINHLCHSNQVKLALKACRLAEVQYPYSEEPSLVKIGILLQNQQPKEALQEVRRAEAKHPGNMELRLFKAESNYLLGHFKKAVAIYRGIQCRTKKEQAVVLLKLGMALEYLKDYDQAIDVYKRAVKLMPKMSAAYSKLTLCIDHFDSFALHLPFYRQQVDVDPYSGVAWHHLGLVFEKMNRYDEALQAFDYCTVADPEYYIVYLSLGNLHSNLEQYDEALKAFNAVLKFEQYPMAYYGMGWVYESQGDCHNAIRSYRRVNELEEGHSPSWYRIGCCLMKLERWYEAIHFFEKATKLSPDVASYWKKLAEAECNVDNLSGSHEAFKRANEIDPQNVAIWLDWSFLYYKQGLFRDATNLLERALNGLPLDAKLHYRITAYLIQAARYKEAMVHFETALQLDYEGNTSFFECFPHLVSQPLLQKLVNHYRRLI